MDEITYDTLAQMTALQLIVDRVKSLQWDDRIVPGHLMIEIPWFPEWDKVGDQLYQFQIQITVLVELGPSNGVITNPDNEPNNPHGH